MGGFSASLLVPGDSEPLKALLLVEEGRFGIRSGSHRIGEWNLDDVVFRPTQGGFRIEVEGEELIVDMDDPAALRDALAAQRPKERYAWAKPIIKTVDSGLAKAEKAWGSLLPEWAFSRRTAAIVGGILLIMIVLPALFSSLLLLAGFAVVVFGAVVYTDDGMAVRVLPGRMTAMHVIIGGTGIVVLGFLLGVVAG